jgi:hypothetical protein
MIDKAAVVEKTYVNPKPIIMKSAKQARTELLCMLLQPWITRERMKGLSLKNSLRLLDLPRAIKKQLFNCISDYVFCGGTIIWNTGEIPQLQHMLRVLLEITNSEFERIVRTQDADALRLLVKRKTLGLSDSEVNEVCHVLTKVGGETSDSN